MLFGLIRPDGGSIEIAGVSVQPVPVSALEGVAGFVETPRFYPYLSGRKNLELLARLDGNGGAARIDDVLGVVELADRAGSKVGEYSYGMVQRLGVAAALMREPRLLVLDEPTNGLDPAGIRDMRTLIQRLAGSGLTVLLSSHHMDEVEEMCTRVAIMRRGQIAFDGSMSELRGRAGRATRHLVTTDDATALTICQTTEGVVAAAREGSLIVFDADDETVERLSRELVGVGLGIQRLHAPTSALETLFFRLTDSKTGDDEGVAA
jgi:ABC-2 type transport system ATP-binding protein